MTKLLEKEIHEGSALLEKEIHEGSAVVERDIRIPTRDGGFVAADFYRPAGTGPSPALYAVSP